MGLLTGKKILVTGVASKRSIAWGIAQSMHREGATLAFTYMGDRLKDRVIDLAAQCDSDLVLPCDVQNDDEISAVFKTLGEQWGTLDGFVHAIAFAPSEELAGDFVDNTTREGYKLAHEVSAYSFTAMAKAARPILNPEGASLMTLTYLGAERTLPNYNVMGLAKASLEANTRYMAVAMGKDNVRVNAISAGPIKTLAASGIGDLKKMLDYNASASPLKRNVTIEQVGDTAAFLASNWSSGITGQTIYVDSGFSITAMPSLD
ncbi:MAG: enoyl-ACP reductase [Gammaproteobacteria bacterium]|nr:enoyl-ACP reductase [Gammaproteobacteria bacterium]